MNKQIPDSFKPLDAELPTIESSASVLCPRLDSKNLFASANEVIIEHAGEEYHLRLTRQNKLILTK
jgi:hemin uptake protein HemP